jgi:hypothetical protein
MGFNYYQAFYEINSNAGPVWYDGERLRTPLNRDEKYIIKIDNVPYAIQLTKKDEWSTYERQWYTLWIWNKETEHIKYYSWASVFQNVFNAIKTNSMETGTHYIKLDLSYYFSLYKYNESNSQWDIPANTDIMKTYSILKFHYSKDGVKTSNQSMFHVINDDPSYDLVEYDYDTTYWQERIQYVIDENELSYRYSEVYRGYFASLPLTIKNMFDGMPRAEVTVSINKDSEYLTSRNINLVGFDYNAFENLRIANCNLYGSGDFILLSNSLCNTGLSTVNASSDLNIIYGSNVFVKGVA